MNGSKWTWIRDTCIMSGYMESAKLAQAIEDALIKAYGYSSTEGWRELKEESLLDIWAMNPKDIVAYGLLCRGCVETGDLGCDDCRYAKIAGRCNSDNSLYGLFRYMFAIERVNEKKGKR